MVCGGAQFTSPDALAALTYTRPIVNTPSTLGGCCVLVQGQKPQLGLGACSQGPEPGQVEAPAASSGKQTDAAEQPKAPNGNLVRVSGPRVVILVGGWVLLAAFG